MDRNPGLPPAPDDRAFVARINNVVARKLSGQVQAHNPVWSGLGMAGLVGWSVTIPTVLGTTLVITIFTVIGSLLADVLYAIADPRIRLGSSS